MSQDKAHEIISVIVEPKEKTNTKVYNLSGSKSLNDVFRKWKEDSEVKTSVQFLDHIGHFLPLSTSICDVSQVAQGLVRLSVEEEIEVQIMIHGQSGSIRVPAYPSQTFEQLMHDTCQGRVAEDFMYTNVELTNRDGRLSMSSTVSSLLLQDNSRPVLFMRVPMNMNFCDDWENEEFSFEGVDITDNCETIRNAIADGKQYLKQKRWAEYLDERRQRELKIERQWMELLDKLEKKMGKSLTSEIREKQIQIWKRAMGMDSVESNAHKRIVSDRIYEEQHTSEKSAESDEKDEEYAVTPQNFVEMFQNDDRISFVGTVEDHAERLGAPWKNPVLYLNIPRNLLIASTDNMQRVKISQSETLSWFSRNSPVLVGDVLHQSDERLYDMNLAEDAVVFVDIIIVELCLTSKDQVTVTLPCISTVGDLRRKASEIENEKFVDLLYGSRFLCNDNELLSDTGVRSHTNIHVEKSVVDLSVDFNGSLVEWQKWRPYLTYTDIIDRLCFETGVEFEDMSGVVLCCKGCGRNITEKEEKHQRIPVGCCSRQSKELKVLKFPVDRERESMPTRLKSLQQLHAGLEEEIKTLLESQRILKDRINDLRKTDQQMAKEKKHLEKINGQLVAEKENLEKRIDHLTASMEELGKRNKGLQETSDQLKIERESLEKMLNRSQQEVKDLRGKKATGEATELAIQPSGTAAAAAETAPTQTGVELLIFYDDGFFTPVVSHPAVQQKEKYPWLDLHHIKCEILEGLQTGFVSFKTMQEVLQSFFSGMEICRIGQLRGTTSDRTVAQVTSLPGDEKERYLKSVQLCDSEGNQSSWAAAGKPKLKWIEDGDGDVLICGRRRTVLSISHV